MRQRVPRGPEQRNSSLIVISRGTMVKGKSWSKAEDLACAKAFVRASENPEKGVDQRYFVFVRDVFTQFLGLAPSEQPDIERTGRWDARSPEAVAQRFKRIRSEAISF